jgi:ring-1,2-phenylacetyl-CoA epoxidase subunit PaaD
MKTITTDQERIIEKIRNIPDPEIPVITIDELGILRDITFAGDMVEVKITPTYSGCPAMNAIENDIKEAVKEEGLSVSVKLVYSPAWTTDWLTDHARQKLVDYGIAPPERTATDKRLIVPGKNIVCPHCGAASVSLVSQFGSTACKAIYKCNICLEPFDYFKCH